jgi:hypothetical protein
MLLPENSLTIIRGTSKTLRVTVTHSSGEVFDLTGSRLVLTVKEASCDDLPLIQKRTNVTGEGEIPAPREGIAKFYLKPVDTNRLVTKSYTFDVWLITPLGDRYCIVQESSFVVAPGVTWLPT